VKSAAATIDMNYTTGDILMFKGIAGQYSNIITDIPTSSKTITFNFVACTDNDGNHYATVQIGTGKSGGQTWMAENLNYNTGNSWCPNGNTSNCNTYGRLYDWQTALGACPSGWHLPSDAEWTALTDFLGGESIAGGKMKEAGTAHWLPPPSGATNSSGFTALPGGWTDGNNGFGSIGSAALFWSSTEDSTSTAWSRILSSGGESVYRNGFNAFKYYGYSARCIHD
jgi:uncharacterized protein (TIGR02145 family)